MFSNRILGGLWDFTGLLAINAEYKQGAEVMNEPANDTSNDFDDFIKHLQLLTETNLAITVEQFNLMLSALCDRFTFDHMEAIVDFASNQRGQWEAEYLFSFVDAPNKKAKFEAEGWNDLIKKWIQLLVEISSDKKYEECAWNIHKFVALYPVLKKRAEYNNDKPLRRILVEIYSKVSFLFYKVRLRRIAVYFKVLSLYPKGTLGRLEPGEWGNLFF